MWGWVTPALILYMNVKEWFFAGFSPSNTRTNGWQGVDKVFQSVILED